jgi:beta-glucanase (GH16 family)
VKKITKIMLLVFFNYVPASFSAPPVDEGYVLKWSDEFDGTTLDLNNWSYETGVIPPFSSSDPAYNTEGLNLTFENGAAVLWAKHESYNGHNYTSCRINTHGKKEFKYGYIEVRLKSPEGKGLWPLFMTLGTDLDSIGFGWPVCGEFDIFNTLTGPDNYRNLGDEAFQVTCYFRGADNQAVYTTQKYQYIEKLSFQYHLYAIEWDSLKIQYFFDGQKIWEYDSINESYNFRSFHQPHFFTADIHVGGNYQGNSIDPSIFPQAMYIDYVRVYQKSTQVKANPQKNMVKGLTLANKSVAQLRIYDLQGRLIGDYTDRVRHLNPGKNVMKGIVSDLPIGIYVTTLFDGVRTVSETLVIQK